MVSVELAEVRIFVSELRDKEEYAEISQNANDLVFLDIGGVESSLSLFVVELVHKIAHSKNLQKN